MPSLIDLRRRIRAVKNTQQITKAMKMVAASKLRRAQERVMSARPYAVQMQRVLGSVASRVDPSIHPLLTVREPNADSRTLVIVVTADKGLCGSFNTNVIKAAGHFVVESKQPCTLGLVGRKGKEFFSRRGFDVLFEQVGIFQKLRYEDARAIAQTAMDAFLEGKVDRVMLVYNEFRSVMTQRVVVDQLLPIARGEVEGTGLRCSRRCRLAAIRARRSTTSTSRRRRRSSTSCCRATSRCRFTGRCSNRTPRSTPRR